MDADVCIHCTFRDIGIIPGSTLVESQRQAYFISRDLPRAMLAMRANMQEQENLQQQLNLFLVR